MSLAVVDFTKLWCCVGQDSPTICFGHPEHLLEKHHSLSVDMEKQHQMSTHFFNLKAKWKMWHEGMKYIIEIRPLLPGEISAWFPAEMLQTQACN